MSRPRSLKAAPDPEGPMPPHSPEAERGLLREVLLGGAVALSRARAIVQTSDFYDSRHRAIFDTMIKLHDSAAPMEIASLNMTLIRTGRSDEAGGPAYLGTLLEC